MQTYFIEAFMCHKASVCLIWMYLLFVFLLFDMLNEWYDMHTCYACSSVAQVICRRFVWNTPSNTPSHFIPTEIFLYQNIALGQTTFTVVDFKASKTNMLNTMFTLTIRLSHMINVYEYIGDRCVNILQVFIVINALYQAGYMYRVEVLPRVAL